MSMQMMMVDLQKWISSTNINKDMSNLWHNLKKKIFIVVVVTIVQEQHQLGKQIEVIQWQIPLRKLLEQEKYNIILSESLTHWWNALQFPIEIVSPLIALLLSKDLYVIFDTLSHCNQFDLSLFDYSELVLSKQYSMTFILLPYLPIHF